MQPYLICIVILVSIILTGLLFGWIYYRYRETRRILKESKNWFLNFQTKIIVKKIPKSGIEILIFLKVRLNNFFKNFYWSLLGLEIDKSFWNRRQVHFFVIFFTKNGALFYFYFYCLNSKCV